MENQDYQQDKNGNVIDTRNRKARAPYYVTMTDKFFSNWGWSENRINKLIFLCDTWQEVENVMNKARTRDEMKYINFTETKPYYNPARYFAQYKTRAEYPNWYE